MNRSGLRTKGNGEGSELVMVKVKGMMGQKCVNRSGLKKEGEGGEGACALREGRGGEERG